LEYEISRIKSLLNVKLYFEGPSSHYTREFIEILNEYLTERLPVIFNDVLEPYGLEASLLSSEKARALLGDEAERKLVLAIYSVEEEKPLLYAVFHYRVGDNTLELQLEKLLKAAPS